VTLVFCNTIVSRTGNKIREEVSFPYNKRQILQRRARTGLLPSESQGVANDGEPSIRWVKKLGKSSFEPIEAFSLIYASLQTTSVRESNPYCISSGESDVDDDIISISSDD